MQEAEGEQLRLLADNAPAMIWRAGRSRGCDLFNRPWLEFTGRSLEQELGHGWMEGVHPEDREARVRTYEAAFEARRPFTMDFRLRRHDGAWRWVLDSGRPYEVNGEFAGFLGSCIDITEMKMTLEERRQMLAERERLLAELHHRVKNNTQATTSFLALQAARASSPEVAEALRAAATRVALASQVQDRMFRLTDAEGVDLGEELVTTARLALEITGRPGLRLEERIEATMSVPVGQATPLALIVNELVVNAARHGFPDGRSGCIRLTLRQPAPGQGEILVEDDGVGLPASIRQQVPRHHLGLNLAPRLARQARARLRFEVDGGTRAILSFRPG